MNNNAAYLRGVINCQIKMDNHTYWNNQYLDHHHPPEAFSPLKIQTALVQIGILRGC